MTVFPRLAAIAAAVAMTLPGAVMARSDEARATVELATPAAKERGIAGGVVWQCKGTTCQAAVSSKRPLRVCREVAREFGEVVRYEAPNKVLEADDIARCNS